MSPLSVGPRHVRTKAPAKPRRRRGKGRSAPESARRVHNLPVQLTSFVGRAQELADVRRLLSTAALVTLTGTGGSGKTRLALHVAAGLVECFRDGVWLAELGPVSDPRLVAKTVASALGVPEQPGRSLVETLRDYLSTKDLLLVLDNCEHVRAGSRQVAEALLRESPGLRILATSREVLAVDGEATYLVPPLGLPDQHQRVALDVVAGCEAIRLFVDRAALSDPKFALTPDNVSAVADMCRRLDGIPLAIEFAAAQVNVLSVNQIAARLSDRFGDFGAATRKALPQHQTLWATMDWSYDLLSAQEQKLFRRLSVFAGGWTLPAAEAVCCGDGVEPAEILHVLSRLVEKSLVMAHVRGPEARYRLLETVRQYASDRLPESEDAAEIGRRHRDWFLRMVEQADPMLRGPEQVVWAARLEIEHDNLRAALEFTGTEADGDATGFRLAGALAWFWFLRGHWSEGLAWLERWPGATGPRPGEVKALVGAAHVAYRMGEYGRARAFARRGLDLCGSVAEDDPHKPWLLFSLGLIAEQDEDNAAATRLYEESARLARETNDRWILSTNLNQLGGIARRQGDYARAIARHEESLALGRALGDKFLIVYHLRNLGADMLLHGHPRRATTHYVESLTLSWELRDMYNIESCLWGFADIAAVLGDHERCARLLGAADAVRELLGHHTPAYTLAAHQRCMQAARDTLGDDGYDAVWKAGRAMTLEQAVAYALAAPAVSASARGGRDSERLTPREREVGALVADGLTNKEIAARLGIGERTAETHVQHLLEKLGVSSRGRVAARLAALGVKPM
jgi:predicted ATPase/DNA-binding CsgD family transcriptional regulator